MKFRTLLELHGKSATGFEVPSEVVEALGTGNLPPVKVTLAIGAATTPETRARRIASAITKLKVG